MLTFHKRQYNKQSRYIRHHTPIQPTQLFHSDYYIAHTLKESHGRWQERRPRAQAHHLPHRGRLRCRRCHRLPLHHGQAHAAVASASGGAGGAAAAGGDEREPQDSVAELLSARKFRKSSVGVDQGTCAICLCEFEDDEELRTLPEWRIRSTWRVSICGFIRIGTAPCVDRQSECWVRRCRRLCTCCILVICIIPVPLKYCDFSTFVVQVSWLLIFYLLRPIFFISFIYSFIFTFMKHQMYS